jgi:hypothetical protein
MHIDFSCEAKAEFDDAMGYYEQQIPGLGVRFRDEVRAALRRLGNWPLAASVERGDIRRALLGRFDYKLLNAVETYRIYVLAVAHQQRAPEYWIERGK